MVSGDIDLVDEDAEASSAGASAAARFRGRGNGDAGAGEGGSLLTILRRGAGAAAGSDTAELALWEMCACE